MVHFEIHQEGESVKGKPLFDQHIKQLKEADSLEAALPLAALLTSDLLSEGLALYINRINALKVKCRLFTLQLPLSYSELLIFWTQKYCKRPVELSSFWVFFRLIFFIYVSKKLVEGLFKLWTEPTSY